MNDIQHGEQMTKYELKYTNRRMQTDGVNYNQIAVNFALKFEVSLNVLDLNIVQ